ncbi:MAG: SAM-dependent chlorinase/fluorinase [Candidatus Woesebacteria bacterium]|jgi:hypothetical protein
MFINIINDSSDDNARQRQVVRWSSIFPKGSISFTKVGGNLDKNSTLEAAGNLIDSLDASQGKKGVISVNVAPRGDRKDGENGSKFCYFYYKSTLVISTVQNYSLSLVKEVGLINSIHLLDTQRVSTFANNKGLIDENTHKRLVDTQFRSFEFQPRVARWLTDGVKIPSKSRSINTTPKAPDAVWLIDSFGNAKTTIMKDTTKDVSRKYPGNIKTNLGAFKVYNRLKDIPKKDTAVYIGSSGIGNKRFLEIATQAVAGSAAKKLDLKVGQEFKIL